MSSTSIASTGGWDESRWMRYSDGEIVNGSSLIEGEPSIVLTDADSDVPSSLIKFHHGWRLERYFRFSPCIVYTAFGSSGIFEMLHLSIRSVMQDSCISPYVFVITNEAGVQAVHRILDELGFGDERCTVQVEDASNRLEYAMARYSAGRVLTGYSPILYLDTDVLCDNALVQLSIEVLRRVVPMVAPEGRVKDERNHWGNSLFARDSSVRVADSASGFSTGIIGTANATVYTAMGEAVLHTCREWHGRRPPEFELLDQPIAVYALLKSGFVDNTAMSRFVRLNGHGGDPDPSAPARLGLVHFQGGVGNSEPKLLRMRRYMEILDGLR